MKSDDGWMTAERCVTLSRRRTGSCGFAVCALVFFCATYIPTYERNSKKREIGNKYLQYRARGVDSYRVVSSRTGRTP